MEKDLNDLLGGLLNSPEAMDKLQGMLSSLGAGAPGASSPPPPALPESDLLGRLTPLLSAMGSGGADDRNVTLLKALRPYLHEGREKRVDQAIEMLRLAKLLPLLNKP